MTESVISDFNISMFYAFFSIVEYSFTTKFIVKSFDEKINIRAPMST